MKVKITARHSDTDIKYKDKIFLQELAHTFVSCLHSPVRGSVSQLCYQISLDVLQHWSTAELAQPPSVFSGNWWHPRPPPCEVTATWVDPVPSFGSTCPAGLSTCKFRCLLFCVMAHCASFFLLFFSLFLVGTSCGKSELLHCTINEIELKESRKWLSWQYSIFLFT